MVKPSHKLRGHVLDARAHIKDQLIAAVDVFRAHKGLEAAGKDIDNWDGTEKPKGYVDPRSGQLPSGAADARVLRRDPLVRQTKAEAADAGAQRSEHHDGALWAKVGQHLGRAMHAFEDFWSHSAWLEEAKAMKGVEPRQPSRPKERLATADFGMLSAVHALGHKLVDLSNDLAADRTLLTAVSPHPAATARNAPQSIPRLRTVGQTLSKAAGALAGPGSHAAIAKDSPGDGDHDGAMALAIEADKRVFGPLRKIMEEQDVGKARSLLLTQLALVDAMLTPPSPSHPLWHLVPEGVSGPMGPAGPTR
jgi:hypothetical protein